MSEDHKKPGVAFWATVVVVVVLVVYPAMWGPLWWAHVKFGEPPWAASAILRIYAPMLWVIHRGPSFIGDTFIRYRFWGMNLAEEQNRQDERT